MVTLVVLVGGAGEILFPQQNIYLQRKNGAALGTAEVAFGLEVRSYFPLKTFFPFQKYSKSAPD